MKSALTLSCVLAAAVLADAGLCMAVEMGESDRGVIVSRMRGFLEIPLSTNRQQDWDCLVRNLDRDEYRCSTCDCTEDWPVDPQPCRSDILAHYEFLHGVMSHAEWQGMNYLFGGTDTPDRQMEIQNRIDACRGLGAHQCHHGCGHPASWAVGADCSSAVSYAGGVTRGNTSALNSDDYGVVLPWSLVQKASYIVKSQVHVVLVESRDGQSIQILEQTGHYPVGRRAARSISYYQDRDYTPRDFCAVASAQGSDGKLLASIAGEKVRLSWRVDSASGTRWYEFQRRDPGRAAWVVVSRQEFRGPGVYEVECDLGPAGAVYRVAEMELAGTSVEHTGTLAFERY